MGVSIDRRQFVFSAATVAGGFALGLVPLETLAKVAPSALPLEAGAAVEGGAFAIGDWVRITRDDEVTLVVSQAEMGQGISTTLPAVLADELGADWSRVRLELAPTATAYRNPRFDWQFTGNSESTQSFYEHLRRIGAAARGMLLAAGAERLQVPVTELTTRDGRVVHVASGRRLAFGELAEAAARLKPPEQPAPRPDSELRLVGRALPRVDQAPKADGTALFGIDYVPAGLEGLLFAAVRSAPAYGARPQAVKNRDAVLSRPGVVDMVMLPTAVAVVARRYWQARAALAAAEIEFDAGPHAAMTSATLAALYREKMTRGPVQVVAERKGEGTGAISGRFEATYELGFQAHATLEPMNALARVGPQGVDVWAPTQGQDLARIALSHALGVKPEDVRVHRSPFLGGGFGRRLLPDFVVEAALLSRAVGGRPVKLIWSREEDMRRDHFRPATLQRLEAALDARGRPQAVSQRLVSPTILKPVYPPLDLGKGVDPSSIEGTVRTRYRIPGWRAEFHLLEIPVPTSVYRTTGWGPSIFGLESFIDELAHRAGADPLAYRRALLAHDARAARVLDRLARESGWGGRLPKGRGRGVAFTDAFETVLAQVVEVTVRGRNVHVDRIVTVADPGRVFDPRIAEQGLEGGAIWALSSAAKGEIRFDGGGPLARNFHEYDLVRMKESPRFRTVLLESPGERIGGVGEVGPVATVPALANAIFAAAGRRLRTLPLARTGLTLV